MTQPLRIVIDSREQRPWRFPADVEPMPGSLDTGDYSLAGLEHLAAIERKSLADFCGCCGRERDRFQRELQRLKAYKCRAVIIEATMGDVAAHRYRSKIAPASVLGSAAAWQTRYGTPFVWAENREQAAHYALLILRGFHRDCLRFAKTMAARA